MNKIFIPINIALLGTLVALIYQTKESNEILNNKRIENAIVSYLNHDILLIRENNSKDLKLITENFHNLIQILNRMAIDSDLMITLNGTSQKVAQIKTVNYGGDYCIELITKDSNSKDLNSLIYSIQDLNKSFPLSTMKIDINSISDSFLDPKAKSKIFDNH